MRLTHGTVLEIANDFFLLLCALALSSIDAWSSLPISPHIYGYDDEACVYTRQITESGAQNQHYDDTLHLCYCCSKSDLQEKSLDGSIFALVDYFVVAKGIKTPYGDC